VAALYADGLETPRVAVGVQETTPRATIRRGALSRAIPEASYADGNDIWPSA
jgi:hypothetical protein